MAQPRLQYVTCTSPAGLHRVAYWEWGREDNPEVVFCVHGLTRCGRDFDVLAEHLSGRYRVICPDIAGRGRSDWLINPAFYTIAQYVADMVTVLARVRAGSLSWVGTSMGGLIGLALAGALAYSRQPGVLPMHPDPLPGAERLRMDKLVLNDVGPQLAVPALVRIAQPVGQPVMFDRYESAVDYVRTMSHGFGPHSDAQWRYLTQHVFKQVNGFWVKHYDLRLAATLAVQDPATITAGQQLLWQSFDAVDFPMLLLRGAQSDLLTAPLAAHMHQRNSRLREKVFAGVGHAPTLLHDDQIQAVEQFLNE